MSELHLLSEAFVFLFVVLVAATALASVPEVPEAEKALLNTVDPWGLAFSDQLVRFESYFAGHEAAPFAIGLTHDLVKVWPVKYWFRGQVAPAGGSELVGAELWAAAGETQGFQVAVLPRMGAPDRRYSISAEASAASVEVMRQVFVHTSARAAYPRFASDRWPDPLVPETTVTVGGTDCAVFWVDVAIPPDAPTGTIYCRVRVSDGTVSAQAVVPIRVVSVPGLDPKGLPFIAWFSRRGMTEEQYREMCALVLRHHVVPIDALKGQWDPVNPERFDELRTFLEAHGQRIFEVEGPDSPGFDALYAHLRERGWLDSTWIYSNRDEPDHATFVAENIPFMERVRAQYPGLRVYLASDWHQGMERGCDAWMTDLSASGYDPERHRNLERPQLWHYYCHLPVRWQMRAPLVQAPNMQIDNPAVEHRIALWMSDYYGAHVVFLWSGNAYTFAPDFWQTLRLSDEPSTFPYAGVHNGNGWVVYPAPDGQATLPSLRLKVIRDGLEDVALLRAARAAVASGRATGARAEALAELANPVPSVFANPHYFNPLPEGVLARRAELLRALRE